MAHQLSFITHPDVLKAMENIDKNGVPPEHQWNEYWIYHKNKAYPFKYATELAAIEAGSPKRTVDFRSNASNRKAISNLGFNIRFLNPSHPNAETRFWISASSYGSPGDQVDKLPDFISNSYWATDHDPQSKEGGKIYNKLKAIAVFDRIAVRYLSRKSNTVEIVAVGTVESVVNLAVGRLEVKWDLQPLLYKGEKPKGSGAGDWWKTLIEITRPEDRELLFGYAKNFNRAARLSWNTNGWVYPSGSIGKSTDKGSHEAQYGYGHEEWLFDTGKLIDGYHYGFLEPIRKHQQSYIGKSYDLWLYSINGITKLRYWIGEIRAVEVIDERLADEINELYKSSGWFEEMEEQIISSGANKKGFSNYKGIDLFNIRFKPEYITLNDPYYELPLNHAIYKAQRYTLLFQNEKISIESPLDTGFSFQPPSNPDEEDAGEGIIKRGVKMPAPKPVEIVYLHDAICRGLTKKLRLKYGKNNVTREHTAGYGQCRVDIVVNDNDGLIFYEVKSYTSLISSIREAIGQLMEYGYWPDGPKAKKLIIVTQTLITPQALNYLKYLRDNFGFPIAYQSYDHVKDYLSVEV